jgi:phage shock protein PspC (stress-responsive transcriptional regulator)
MKKTMKVSLGGFAYDLEEDAFLLLDNYLNTIKSRLGTEKEAHDIIQDIEDRISELFAEKKGTQEAISADIVKEIIEILGKPEEIVSESANPGSQSFYSRTNKRMYRDSDHSYIAGVCSGLGEFFGTDPIVIRILFIVLLCLHGFGLLLYIVLWIALPRAITPKQKLEMKGEPINVSNIEKTIREEYTQVNESLKKRGVGGFIEKLVYFIGRLLYWFIQFLLVLVKAIAIIIAIVLIISMLVTIVIVFSVVFFGGAIVNHAVPEIHGIPLSEVITSMFEFSSTIWLTIPIFLIIAIPLFALLYLGIRILFRFKARDGMIGLIAASVWIVAIVILAFALFYQAKSFTIRQQVKETIELAPKIKKGGTLYIKTTEKADSLYSIYSEAVEIDDYSIKKIEGKMIITGKPEVTIEKGTKEYPVIEFIRKARGGTKLSAEMNAKNITYSYTLKDSVLYLDSYFTIPAGEKWKLQDLSIILQIPENYKIFIDNSMEDIMNIHQPSYKYWPDEITDKKWTMKENMLKELEK